MKIKLNRYIWYKRLNSLFLGISIGSTFAIYESIEPKVFSLGGIFLAIGMLIVSYMYSSWMNLKSFFKINLFVEILMIFIIFLVLFDKINPTSALLVYLIYQLSFIFGGYLSRAETLFLREVKIISLIDRVKQSSYLFGMFFAYIFYQFLENINIKEKITQITLLHIPLGVVQILIIVFLILSFKTDNPNKKNQI